MAEHITTSSTSPSLPSRGAAGFSRHVGRVGGLAVALGIGAAVAGFGAAIASADSTAKGDTGSSTSASASGSAGTASSAGDAKKPSGASAGKNGNAATGGGAGVDGSAGQAGAAGSHGQSTESAANGKDVDAKNGSVQGAAADKDAKKPTASERKRGSETAKPASTAVKPTVPARSASAGTANVDADSARPSTAAPRVSQVVTTVAAPIAAATKPVTAPVTKTSVTTLASTIVANVMSSVADVFSPFMTPGRKAPADSPAALTLLALARNQEQRRYSTEAIAPQTSTEEVSAAPMAFAARTAYVPAQAKGDLYTLPFGGRGPYSVSAAVGLLANDTGQGRQVNYLQQGFFGALSGRTDGSLSYTPSYTGIYGLTELAQYGITDSSGATSAALVGFYTAAPNSSVRGPEGVADNFQNYYKNWTLKPPYSFNVLTNDKVGSAQYKEVGWADSRSVAGGKVEVYANGNFTYTPPLNFVGRDMFRYAVSDRRGGVWVTPVYITTPATSP